MFNHDVYTFKVYKRGRNIGFLDITQSSMIENDHRSLNRALSNLFRSPVHTYLPTTEKILVENREQPIHDSNNAIVGRFLFVGAKSL